ncbi:hypothetical protein PGTUg99_024624 [Puccinia graminis f. sp. tritici]|uniref:NADH dehydrogenase [ubiquinone] iron-sulfur protein 4, mitochondrial n=2 Tax=Puccinia graminis f. sp. tritici TaxID=56615 RepID=E3KIQ5_PUCGT|nr:NADH dehydrogenase (ubiquinone) Fe-S protein 4 [Puccinia graminis f. sp. tritici CRL 75-36-700-3]EFP84180.1 NADH dehydrogenase (ubiquinone) Fe-S protein 4 [Puccinia graminis f. sp. tritici CRL 75-36-700-3]KAA1114148.1 hypothetical protein PGTUg99_024624 [Puccinia graminis f. sp. tritici]
MFSQALLRSTRQTIATSRACKPTTTNNNGLRKAFYSDDKSAGQQLSPATTERPSGIQPASSSDDPQLIPAGLTSGAPEQLAIRPVRIYRPSPTTMQSAKANNHTWVLDWETLQGAGRWENPLMGWASTADYMQGTNLKFDSSEAAVAFCEKQGWPYFVQAPKAIKFKVKSYSDNYLYSDSKLRIHKTK